MSKTPKKEISHIINHDVYNFLKEYIQTVIPVHRRALLTFDDFSVSSINNQLCPKFDDNSTPERCIILQVKFFTMNRAQILGSILYFNDTDRQIVALKIMYYVVDLFNLGINIQATMSSGKAEMIKILQEFKWEKSESGALIHTVQHHKGIVHLFDPSWMIRNLMQHFRLNDISFEVANAKKTASFDNVLQTIKNSRTNPKLNYQVRKNMVTTPVAVKVFSITNANMIAMLSKDQSGYDTADFCMLIDQIHDSINGSFKDEPKKCLRDLLKYDSIHHAFWKYALNILKTMRFDSYNEILKCPDTQQKQHAVFPNLDTIKEEPDVTELIKETIIDAANFKGKNKKVSKNKADQTNPIENSKASTSKTMYNDLLSVIDERINIHKSEKISDNLNKIHREDQDAITDLTELLVTNIKTEQLFSGDVTIKIVDDLDSIDDNLLSNAPSITIEGDINKNQNKESDNTTDTSKQEKIAKINEDSKISIDEKDKKISLKINNEVKLAAINTCEYIMFYIDSLLTTTLKIARDDKLINKLYNFIHILKFINKEPDIKLESVKILDQTKLNTLIVSLIPGIYKVQVGEVIPDGIMQNTMIQIDNICGILMSRNLYFTTHIYPVLKPLAEADIFSQFAMSICGFEALVLMLFKEFKGTDFNDWRISTGCFNMDEKYSMINYVQKQNKIMLQCLVKEQTGGIWINEELCRYAFTDNCNDTVRIRSAKRMPHVWL